MRSLYWRAERGRVLVATEVAQILAVADVPARIDEVSLALSLVGPEDVPERTAYEGISRLLPGHVLVAEEGAVRTWEVADLRSAPPVTFRREEEYHEAFREAFSRAVAARLRSVKPVGVLLSGGVDSGSVASMAGWLVERGMSVPGRLQAFCWAYEELPQCDERPVSDHIVQRYGYLQHDVPADEGWPLRGHPAHGPHRDEPYIWPYQPLFDDSLAAAQQAGLGVLINGQGGDELLGDWIADELGMLLHGRWRSLARDLRVQLDDGATPGSLLRQRLAGPLLDRWAGDLRNRRRQVNVPPWVEPSFARRVGLADLLRDVAPPHGPPRVQRAGHVAGPAIRRILRSDERRWAQHGLSMTSPFTDVHVARLVIGYPQWRVNAHGDRKRLARRALAGIVPEGARRRLAKLEPVALYDRGMKERAVPLLHELFTGSVAAARGYVDEGAVRRIVREYADGRTPFHDPWWPISTELWLRAHWGQP